MLMTGHNTAESHYQGRITECGGLMKSNHLGEAQLEQLLRLSTCVVASAIETFKVRLPNTGFADASVKCVFPELPPVIGYAITARMRSSGPPVEGGSYYERWDWWNHILTGPQPRIVVIEDMDGPPGRGAFVGEVHANILAALGCKGLITNGAVRDLPQIREVGFQMFAGNVSVSHAYAHIFDFGCSIQVGNLTVSPGDLVQGDIHGVQTIPLEIADRVPEVAEAIMQRRHKLVEICKSYGFTLDMLKGSSAEFTNMRAEGIPYDLHFNNARKSE